MGFVLGVTSFLWFAVGIGGVGGLVFAMQNTGESFFFAAAPEEAYFALLGLFGLWAFTSFFGVAGNACKSTGMLSAFIALGILTVLVTTVLFVYIILLFNGIKTVEEIDGFVATSATGLAVSVIEQASIDPAGWALAQNDLKCCGFDFQTLLSLKNTLETGALCATADLASAACPNNVADDACKATEFARLQIQPTFFCKYSLVTFVKDQVVVISSAAGAFVLIQLIAIVSARTEKRSLTQVVEMYVKSPNYY